MIPHDECAALYASSRDGQAAVERLVREKYPHLPWRGCPGCESVEPCADGACLVCGTPVKEQR